MSSKIRLPKSYLIFAALLIIYGWALTFYLRYSSNYAIIHRLNLISIAITLFWILINLVMIIWMGIKGFERFNKEALFIVFFYFAINTLNAFNIHYDWISYETGHWISIMTKIIETIIIYRLAFKL